MQPDRTNYEIWLIDNLDGKLSNSQKEQLIMFLDDNPDIREEYEELSQYFIRPGESSFNRKNQLKKSASDLSQSQFELLCVASSENDLSEKQKDEIQSVIAGNQDKRETLELIKRLKLIAPDIKFNKKSSLRKLTAGQRIVRLSVIGLSAAAIVSIMISLFNLPFKTNYKPTPLTAIVITSDTNTVKAGNIVVLDSNIKAEKKEILHPNSINVFLTINKSDEPEKKSFPVNSLVGDSSKMTEQIERARISKIDYIHDVKLVEKEFTDALLATNTDKKSSIETAEKPGFINAFVARVFREKILKSKTTEAGSVKIYEVADVGINGLNKLFGWQMSLQKTRDEKGDLKSLYFSSKILKFNAPVKKSQL